MPFSSNSPRSTSSARAVPSTPCTVSDAKMPPAGATPSMRLAMITVSPWRSPLSSITSPVCRPMRIDRPLRGMRAVAVVDRELDLAGARHRAPRRLERDHEAVAQPLHDDAAVALDQLERALLDLAPDGVRDLVAELLVQLGRLDEVGEQHRDRALGQRCRRDGLARESEDTLKCPTKGRVDRSGGPGRGAERFDLGARRPAGGSRRRPRRASRAGTRST